MGSALGIEMYLSLKMKSVKLCPYDKLVSFSLIDQRLGKFRTGDLALSCRDDAAGIFILFFTQSLVQHSAIACWVDRKLYEKTSSRDETGNIAFKANNEGDDILMFVHITKRRMYDYYTKTYRPGLVLCSLDEFCKDHLTAVWKRGLSKEIKDEVALDCFTKYFNDRHLELEYENDIRGILGVPSNIVYAPYEHRKICTAVMCDYLEKAYGYPFLISREGVNLTDPDELDWKPREILFKLPTREFEVYRALDFQYENNASPVFESSEEELLYGYIKGMAYTTIHPVNIIFITLILIFVLIAIFLSCMYVKNDPLAPFR